MLYQYFYNTLERIGLRSKRGLFFPPAFNDTQVEMDIVTIQNNINENGIPTYTLKIVDRGYKEVEEEVSEFIQNENGEYDEIIKKITVRKKVGKDIVRGLDRSYTYDELNRLAQAVGANFDDISKSCENINEMFRRGFLTLTNIECASGEGLYGSNIGDFEIIRD